jgi:hypothetical protein
MAQPDRRRYSGNSTVIQHLRECCADITFVDGDGRRSARVVVIDEDARESFDAEPRKSVARIVLYDKAIEAPRRHGDLRVSRAAFLDDPGDTIAAASDLAAIP